jgi:hypothetical protein
MLVGRARELDELERMLEAAAVGRGGLRVVYAAPGIGKTRLADEIAARAAARALVVVWGRAGAGVTPIETLREISVAGGIRDIVRSRLSGAGESLRGLEFVVDCRARAWLIRG